MEQLPTPNFEPGREGERPLAVVLHTTDGTFSGTVAWFARSESGVSAHYLVGLDGRLAQLVRERDTARHAGRAQQPTARLLSGRGGDPNRYTIGIEFEDGGDPEGVLRPDAQYAAGARLIAEISTRWSIPLDRDHVIGHREILAAKTCPGNLDIDRLVSEAAAVAAREETRPLLTALLPVRNGARDIPGYLEAIGEFADSVIALDDGSTDASQTLLRQSSLVRRVIENPARDGFAGWRDDLNRQRLLDAALELGSRWVLFLDADERLAPGDGQAIRAFLESDAVAGCAYGLRLFRDWEGGAVPTNRFVFRLFAPAAGQRLPGQRLHFNPVPEQIKPGAWLPTSARVLHLDSPERLAERRRKYTEVDPDQDFEDGRSVLLVEPQEAGRPLGHRAPSVPMLGGGPRSALFSVEASERDRVLACLLPARNCERDLPGYLASVRGFADFVIALDDGSTDGTREMLAAAPEVRQLLTSSRRESYAGWDDASNRQRLLDAAIEMGVDWALFLDADERVDEADGRALRVFVEGEADPNCAYGMRCFRMVGDAHHYDRAELWVYRLMSPVPERRHLTSRRLHLVPVPEEIPPENRIKTTFRIKHLAGLTAERRTARARKYDEADPDRRWQRDYSALLEAPSSSRPWLARPEGFPPLAQLPQGPAGAEVDLVDLDLDAPILSAIVIARNNESTIAQSLRSIVEQQSSFAFEVILAVSGSDRTAQIAEEQFPGVRVVRVTEPGLPGMARNAGVAVARGEYVSFPGSHIELLSGSLDARIRAHELGYAMVTGTILNGTRTRSGWASYFLDHAGSLPERPSEELRAAPAHCSYVRQFLLEVGSFPESLRAGEDTVANLRLWERGRNACRARDVRLIHRSRCTNPPRLIRHHFARGRALGRIILGQRASRTVSRRGALRFLSGYPGRRLRETDESVRMWGGSLQDEYRAARRLVRAAIASAWLGAILQILTQRRAESFGLGPSPSDRTTPGMLAHHSLPAARGRAGISA